MNETDIIKMKQGFINLFEIKKDQIYRDDPAVLAGLRKNAIESFARNGFPTTNLENWRNTDLKKVLERKYNTDYKPTVLKMDAEGLFECKVHDFDTDILSMLNGWHVYKDVPLKVLPDGTVLGSLLHARERYPELFAGYYGKISKIEMNGFVSLNTALVQDGIFIYVPDGVEVKKPVQMISILNQNSFIQNRNLVILGKNASLKLVQCDDSVNHESSFTNSVTEIFIDEYARLDHYKLQNLNDQSTLINSTFLKLGRSSSLKTNSITLNGGLIRNTLDAELAGEYAEADIFGLYLMDKEQHVDNQVFVDHAKPNCYSNELYKGILDEKASAVFNGHIMVRKGSQKTNAYQNNKNILLTDQAIAHAKPFLEIYADDVKCSHGATVGQLDSDAMFYLQSRGIGKHDARMLLMYAFAADVINKIGIEALKNRIDDMIKKRLRGELSVCDRCVLHCSSPEQEVSFNIDMSKI